MVDAVQAFAQVNQCERNARKEDLFIGPQEFVVGYSKAP